MAHWRVVAPMRLICFALQALLSLNVALAAPLPFAQENSALPRGQIIAKVACAADPSQTYALYLPSNYTGERKWPILFVFHPMARGQAAVETFQEAAEKYGFIVVGSNNSRNGPWVTSLEAIRSVWTDTHLRFSLDEGRAYTAGLSGGARVATRMAQGLPGRVAGVIACGAGFPLEAGNGPSKGTPFIFFATVGIRDFNFRELRELDTTLTGLKLTHRLMVFDGPHQWAPKELLMEALEWMEIQAMKSGRRRKDDALIEKIYTKQSDKALRVMDSGDIAGAYHRMEALVADFQGLHEVSEAEAQLGKWRDSKELKQALKRETKREANIASLELNYYARYERARAALFAPANGEYERRQAIREMRLTELRQLATNKKDTDEGIAAQRNLYGVMVHSFEDSMVSASREDLMRARVDMEIAAECTPDTGYVFYQMARFYALSKDSQNAVAALRKAIEKGFSDLDQLEKDPDFASLRGQPGYEEIVELLKKKIDSTPAASH
jgi:pimeloyl-ACP methyl ester carboxylesterase